MDGFVSREIAKLTQDGITREADLVAMEGPLTILIEHEIHGKHELGITMRTKGNDHLLALGFMFSEGVISSIDDVLDFEILDDVAKFKLRETAGFNPEHHCRASTVTSSCGICGRKSIEGGLEHDFPLLDEDLKISFEGVLNCLESITGKQNIFLQTGGSHACASFNGNGKIEKVFEDIGRHNAFDKMVGHYVLGRDLPLSSLCSFVSGRASFELVQKSIRAGFPIMISIGAPSSLAVDLAKEHGMTLGCFAREESLKIFSGVRRIYS